MKQFLSIYLSFIWKKYLSVCLSICLKSTCLSIIYLKKKYPSVHPSIRLTVCLPVWKSIRLSVHSICLKKSDCPCEKGICLKNYVCLMVWKHLSDRLTVSRNASWGWLESLEQLWLVDLSTGLWVMFFFFSLGIWLLNHFFKIKLKSLGLVTLTETYLHWTVCLKIFIRCQNQICVRMK